MSHNCNRMSKNRIVLIIWVGLIMMVSKATSNGENNQRRQLNATSILGKQARLPCFVQSGRKFIWMQANRDEILSIDGNVITGDSRFGVEHTSRCRSSAARRALPIVIATTDSMFNQTENNGILTNDVNIVDSEKTVTDDGCWVYLIINSVSLYDEGLYVCQIDTMTSTLVNLNILGITGLIYIELLPIYLLFKFYLSFKFLRSSKNLPHSFEAVVESSKSIHNLNPKRQA